VFRHVPGLVAYGAGGCTITLGLATYGFLSADARLAAPGVRAVIILVGAGASLVMWALLRVGWRAHWKFTITADNLVAWDWISRTCHKVEWTAIDTISQRSGWWTALMKLRLNEIETSNGVRIVFGTHLLGYKGFVGELRSRALRLRGFDPHQSGLFDP